MPVRYLITGANGDIGEAIGRIVREAYPDAQIEGADAGGAWPARSTFDVVHRLPYASSDDYIDALEVLAQRGFEVIIPTSEPELRRLAGSPRTIDAMPILISEPRVVTTFLDKLDTARWLAANGFKPPRSMLLSEASAVDLPLIVKPRTGAGGKNHEVIRTPERLAVVKSERDDSAIAQELLDVADQEYTCAVLCFGADVRTLVMRRELYGDRTGKAEVVKIPAIDAVLTSLALAARPEGPLNVQLRLVPDGPKIFEINPRFSSTVMMRHRFGFRDVVWALEKRKGVGLPAYSPPIGALAFRLAREIIVLPSGSALLGPARA